MDGLGIVQYAKIAYLIYLLKINETCIYKTDETNNKIAAAYTLKKWSVMHPINCSDSFTHQDNIHAVCMGDSLLSNRRYDEEILSYVHGNI